MKLSICIPTHDGRRELLREALESIAPQLSDGLSCGVEIIVSDNASRDGTDQMVAEFASQNPDIALRYERNPVDIGLENFTRAVSLSSGDWCWLFGSDDVMSNDALVKLTESIARHPMATAIGFWKANFSSDLETLLQYESEQVIPPRDRPLVLTDPDEVITAPAFTRMVMSCSAFRRDRWMAAARRHPDAARAHPDWPQLAIHESAARHDPYWVWLPAVLLKSRTGTAYIIDEGRAPDMARVHTRMVKGLVRLWSSSYGADSHVYARLMLTTLRTIGSSETIGHIKDGPGHRYRSEPALIYWFTRAFWRLPEYRKTSLGPLLLVGPLWRLKRWADDRRAGRRMPLVRPDQLRATVTCDVPAAIPARSMPSLRCRLRNDGPVVFSARGDHGIALGCRWHDQSGRFVQEGSRTWLARPLRPGQEAEMTVSATTPWEPGEYSLVISAVQEAGEWADRVDPAWGVRASVQVVDAPLPSPR